MRLLLAILGLFVTSTRPVEACTCEPAKSLCGGLARSNTVLVGTVRTVSAIVRGSYDVTVEVNEVFAGTPGKTVQIAIRNAGMSCDYGGYKVSEQMLIAGGMRDGVMSVSACSITAPVAKAAAHLTELRRIGRTGSATIAGRVSVAGTTSRDNIEVRLTNTKQSTRTDASGRYQFTVNPGSYSVATQFDTRLVARKDSPVNVVPGACATHDIDEHWNGRIRGTVRDRAGAAMAGVLVQAIATWQKPPPASENPTPWGPSARTDAAGGYDLGPLGPDTYRVSVGIPFSPREPFSPASSPEVKLAAGAIENGVDLVVEPKLRTHKITARVTLTGPGGPRGVSVTAIEKTSGREYHRYEQPGDFVFVDAAGGTLELRACIGNVGCVTRTVKVDRDQVVALPIETHKVTLRGLSTDPTTKWDWWRVWYDTNYPYSYLVGSPKDKPVEIIGIAGNDLKVTACMLDPVNRQNDLGCAIETVTFDRDRTIDLEIGP